MAEPLRVLHCVAGNLYGGVESLLQTISERQDLCPDLVQEFAVSFEGKLSAELRASGSVVHRLGAVRFSRPWTVYMARQRLKALVTGRGFDIVINHGCWPQLLCGGTVRRTRRPVVFWMHDMIGEAGHWIERGAAKSVPDLVLVHSHCTAATLPRLYPNVWSEILRCPVSARPVDGVHARATIRAELNTPESDVVIVTACRLEEWKGHTLLLEALGRLRDKPGWTSWIAGGVQRPHEQIYLDRLKAGARVEGVEERLRFLGQRNDVPRLLAAADIQCQPNTSPEPFGIAFVEALYASLPVVSTRMGGAAEIVTVECGVLVPPADPEALAEALARLIDDPAHRARLGRRGPARAAELCAPEVVLPRFQGHLKDLIARRPVGGVGRSPARAG